MKIWGISRRDWRERWTKALASIWRILLFRTTFIVVTGSVGKTTAKELILAILSSQAPTLATPSSNNGAFHVAQTILRARPRHRFVVLEVGTSGPGWIARPASIARPDIAVILNVGRTHTDRFPALEDTAKEKAELLKRLRRRGVAILNGDDPRVAAMATRRACRVVRFGLGEQADVRATEITSRWPERLSLTLNTHSVTQRIETRLVGVHWTSSVLAAASTALQCGVSLQQVADAVARVNPTAGRLDPRELPSGAVILRDDFNGTLQTFDAAFRVLREAQAARKILAITTVGDSPEGWDKRLRRIVCEAVGVIDSMVLVGARDDTKRATKAGVAAGFPPDGFHCFTAIAEAAEFLRGFLRAGDLLLLRGRTTDHMERLYHAQTGDVRCWISHCPKRELCERCPELFGQPPASNRGDPGLIPAPRHESR